MSFSSFRYSTLFFLCFCLSTLAGTVPDRISFSYDHAELETVLTQVKSRFGLPLIYRSDLLEKIQVTATCKDCTIETALNVLLQDTPLNWQRFGDQYVLRKCPNKLGTIKGQLTNLDGTPATQLNVRLALAQSSILDLDKQQSDASGHFEFNRLKPGVYVVVITAEGLPDQTVSVEIDGKCTVRELQIEVASMRMPMEEVVVRKPLIDFNTTRRHEYLSKTSSTDYMRGTPGSAFRRLTRLPGPTAVDRNSADWNNQGSNINETALYLDGALIEAPSQLITSSPGPQGFIDEDVVSDMRLIDGALPIEYGDRMGGILAVTTAAPLRDLETTVSFSMLESKAKTAGRFGDGRGTWFFNLREGYSNMADNFRRLPRRNATQRDVTNQDILGKIQYMINDTHFLSVHLLQGQSSFAQTDHAPYYYSSSDTSSEETNQTTWMNLKSFWSSNLQSETVVSQATYHADAQVNVVLGDFFSRNTYDRRRYNRTSLRQDWSLFRNKHQFKWGVDAQRSEGYFDFFDEAQYPPSVDGKLTVIGTKAPGLDTDPIGGGVNTSNFSGELVHDREVGVSSHGYGFYLSDRIQINDSLQSELALRYDEQSHTVDHQWSPRVNLSYQLNEHTGFNFNWGRFYQSQALYQLNLSQREEHYSPAELSEHFVLGATKQFGDSPYIVQMELFHKQYSSLRGRQLSFNGNYLPPDFFLNGSPELTPTEGLARGLELTFKRDTVEAFDWQLNYTLSKADDVVAGESIPRQLDQRHSIFAQFAYKFKGRYQINGTWSWHSGWPTTEVNLVTSYDTEGHAQPRLEFGQRNGTNLPSYQRLDLRYDQQVSLTRNRQFSWYMEIINVFNRSNTTNQAYHITADASGYHLETSSNDMDSVLPVIGIKWDF